MADHPPGRRLRIGIIGFGPFAEFLAEAMLRQEHSLIATSRSDHSLRCSQMGIIFFRDAAEFLEMEIDVVLICTSIVSTEKVLRSIPLGRCRGSCLFVDVLSVKQHPRELLHSCCRRKQTCSARIRCSGRRAGSMAGRGCRWSSSASGSETIASAPSSCKFSSARMVEMPCEEHDRIAARSQFLAHTVGRVLSEMELEPSPIDTKGFQSLLQLRDNTSKDSLDLYLGLFQHNKFAIEELEKLESAFQSVKKKLLARINNGES